MDETYGSPTYGGDPRDSDHDEASAPREEAGSVDGSEEPADDGAEPT